MALNESAAVAPEFENDSMPDRGEQGHSFQTAFSGRVLWADGDQGFVGSRPIVVIHLPSLKIVGVCWLTIAVEVRRPFPIQVRT